jgi:hypothetical protein
MGGLGLEPGTSCLSGITAEVTAVFGLSAGALTPVHQPSASPATLDPDLPSGDATSSDVRPTRGPLAQTRSKRPSESQRRGLRLVPRRESGFLRFSPLR